MAPRSIDQRDPLITDINITPLVDVVLVLLVVLMVVSTYIVSQAMRVELPGETQSADAIDNPLTLTVLRDGQVRLDGRVVVEDQIEQELVTAFTERPDLALVISADEAVPHGRVVQLVDLARRSGGTRFAIKVEEAPSSRAPAPQ